jgi:hypothetical protein
MALIRAEMAAAQAANNAAQQPPPITPTAPRPVSGPGSDPGFGPGEAQPTTRPPQAGLDGPSLSRAQPERTFRLDLNLGGRDVPLYGDAELAAIVAEQLEAAQRRAL